MVLRVRYRGQRGAAARLFDTQPPEADQTAIRGLSLLQAMAEGGLDVMMPGHEGSRWRPLFYDDVRGGWSQLTATCEISQQQDVQVELEDAAVSSYWSDHPSQQQDSNGYFGIGVVRGKTAENHGTIWRSAYQMGAAFTFTVGARFTRQAADTTESWKEVPALQFNDLDTFAQSAPFGAQWVAVEIGGTPL